MSEWLHPVIFVAKDDDDDGCLHDEYDENSDADSGAKN